ncbi:iron uptake transporter deferrochelatase/peroxidase subunit [Brevibacterium sp. VCM10]|uniref:iron uptake transporter deferrochelatase/peroxidase subunit n=1 Tax=Brevibacterium sp. VCM10 TaxID=1381751 RepID=UPI00046F978E|nr:iron uptake transporter deferrochelatase/peroxidase subunit [Brevibacterium sp. VCM10]
MSTDEHSSSADGAVRGIPRRRLFALGGAAGALGIGGLGGGAIGYGVRGAQEKKQSAVHLSYPFRAEKQQGILTPAQDNMFTAAFDVTTTDRQALIGLLRDWTVAAEQMSAGDLVGGVPDANAELPPKDSGEVWGYPASGLTITFGFGATLFVDSDGEDRFGLKDKMPAILKEGVPKFANEALHADASDGDLLVQACANDPQVAVHAIRNLTRIAFGTAKLRWGQIGYGRTSSTSTQQETPRNLFGFKDGTNNIKSEDPQKELDKHLWVQSGDDPASDSWLSGGTYFVARKIHMYLEIWDRVSLAEQEDIIGRDKRFGAPQSVADPDTDEEFTPLDFSAQNAEGAPAIDARAHVAIVAPEHNKGAKMLRRGYNFTDGNDSLGRLDAGLFFISFVRDPRTNFYPILKTMAQKDLLTEYLQHRASALFAIPPGVGTGDTMIGQKLFS